MRYTSVDKMKKECIKQFKSTDVSRLNDRLQIIKNDYINSKYNKMNNKVVIASVACAVSILGFYKMNKNVKK